MDRHDIIQPLLTDYALGELPPDERVRVDAHLATCPDCALEARELSLAFQGIGLSADRVSPPAHLRARVLAEMARQGTDATGASPGAVLPFRRRATAAWLAAAAAAFIITTGTLLVMSMQRTARVEAQLQRAEAERSDLLQQVRETTTQADLAVSILTAADMRRIDMSGVDTSRNAIARAYWSATNGLLIVADRLPAPPPGRVYQVWLIGSSSAGPVSAGLIDNQQSQRGMLIVPAPKGVGGSVTVAVTDEPPGGLAAPTGGKHLIGS